MKKSLSMMVVALITLAAPALATPVTIVEFSPSPGEAGNWHYVGGLLSFDDAAVDKALDNDDALVGALVHIPTFEVGGIPGGPYTLTPLISEISIASDANVTYLTGTLVGGSLGTIGTVAAGYADFSVDITDIMITAEGEALGSAALAVLSAIEDATMDFELSLQGGSGPGYTSFAAMVDGDHAGSGGFSGAMSVPEPTTMGMLGLGSLVLLRKRRSVN